MKHALQHFFFLRYVLGLLCLGLFLMLMDARASSASAQTVQVTEEEKAVFAFHNLIGREPDYESWIRGYPEYQSIPDDLKKDFVEEVMIRLKTGHGTYDLKKDFLKIKTGVLVAMQPTQDDSPARLVFHFPGHTDHDYVPYFPYPYGDQWIAVLAEDLSRYARMNLAPENVTYLRQYFKEDGAEYPAELNFRLRPKSADAKAPLEYDGQSLWLMMGDVATIRCSYTVPDTGQEITLWEYSAPWYLSESEKTLLELLQ